MGYLVCNVCQGYYELQEGESPEDFESCECGGELRFFKSINEFMIREINLNNLIYCPFCGYETPLGANFCAECGEKLNFNISNENFSTNENPEERLSNQNEGITLTEYRRKKTKELNEARAKGALEVKKTIENKGYYDIKCSGDAKLITLRTDCLIIGNNQKIEYQDIYNVEAMKNKDRKKVTMGILFFWPYALMVTSNQTIIINYKDGKIELNNVKKKDAINGVGFIKEKIKS